MFRTFLACLVLQVSGSIIHQYPPLIQAEIGSNVTLTCQIGEMTGYCFSVVWFKLGLEATPRLAPINAYMPGSNTQSRQVEEECHVTLNVQRSDDSGTFFCAYVRGSAIYIGNGSTVLMKKKAVGSLSVMVISPDDDAPSNGGTVTLTCLTFGATAEQLNIYWLVSGRVRNGTPAPTSFSRDADVIRNDIAIEEGAWRDGEECTCVVETPNGQRVQKTVRKKHGVDATLTILRIFEILLFFLTVTATVIILKRFSKKT